MKKLPPLWLFAVKTLRHDRVKSLAAILGVVFACLLTLVQTGMYLGYMQNASSVIDHSTADLWVMRQGTENFDTAQPMSEKVAYQVASISGVSEVEKVILGATYWKTPTGGVEGPQVIGLEPQAHLLRPWNVVEGSAAVLSQDRSILVDRFDMKKLGVTGVGHRAELWEQRAVVRGLTEGVRSFITAPVVFASFKDAQRFCQIPVDQVVYLLIRLIPGASAQEIKKAIAQSVPDVDVHTRKEFSKRTRGYWSRTTGVGVALFTSAFLGVLVGLGVISLTLYMSISDHLKEYGTLKAIGVANRQVTLLVGVQSLLLGGVGGVLGWLGAFLMTHWIVSTGVNVVLPLGTSLVIVGVLLVLCFLSSFLAVQKVFKIEPVLVFEK